MRDALLIRVLKTPEIATKFSPAQWDLLIRQARAANLVSHLYTLLTDAGQGDAIPQGPEQHLKGAHLVTQRHVLAVKWEVSQLREALYELSIPVVLLKGAAYAAAGLPISRGRQYHDIDILVPKSALADVETQLLRWGWRTTHNSAYDQRYYRTWMHELPPLKHTERQTLLDVHHSILPLTAKLKPDAKKLIDGAVNSGDEGNIYWLQPVDMVLHSATHLFHDGELEHGLRDLVDLDSLVRLFSARDGFWEKLMDRAGEMDLKRPLYYAVRYLDLILETPIPESVISSLGTDIQRGKKVSMDWLFLQTLMPPHSSCRTTGSGLARFMLYVRSHYLRMPANLLIPHLVRKSLVKEEQNIPKEIQRFLDAVKESDEKPGLR